MALSVGDILQITDVQTYLDQQVLNVYFFQAEVVGSAITYQDVADYFQTQYVLEVAGAQNAALTHVRTVIKNLTNGLDIFEDPISVPGSDASDAAPSFVAVSVRLVRSTALTRHGAKRYSGISEQQFAGNSLTSGAQTVWDGVADVVGGPIVVDSAGDLDLTLAPVIVGRFPAGDPNAGELDLSKVNPVASGQVIRLSTQTTRRAGRGV